MFETLVHKKALSDFFLCKLKSHLNSLRFCLFCNVYIGSSDEASLLFVQKAVKRKLLSVTTQTSCARPTNHVFSVLSQYGHVNRRLFVALTSVAILHIE